MKIFKHTLAALLLLLFFAASAQFQSPQAIQLTGSGADAKLTGIQSITGADDATNANAVINNTLTFNTATGSTNAFAVSLSGAITAYTTGMVVHFIANSAVTGAATLNVNSLGAITIYKNYNVNLIANDIQNGQAVTVIYDGTYFQMLSQLGNAVSGPTGIGYFCASAGTMAYDSSGCSWGQIPIGATGNLLTISGGIPTWAVPATNGTVTNFSAGTLSPLFTTSVATATTNPSLSFSLSNARAYTVFGDSTTNAAAPTFYHPILASGLFQSQGTTTTVLHGNAGGNPVWVGVNLLSDVFNSLPVTNGGTGRATYTNGQLLIGNSTGSTLTPATLTSGGGGIVITNGPGSITIANKDSGGFFYYVAKTTNYTLAAADLYVDFTTNNDTATLPTAVGISGKYYVINNSGTGSVNIKTTSSQTIDGNASGTLNCAQNKNYAIISDGSNWKILSAK